MYPELHPSVRDFTYDLRERTSPSLRLPPSTHTLPSRQRLTPDFFVSAEVRHGYINSTRVRDRGQKEQILKLERPTGK